MRKIRCYAAVFGIVMAAAVSVTACGGQTRETAQESGSAAGSNAAESSDVSEGGSAAEGRNAAEGEDKTSGENKAVTGDKASGFGQLTTLAAAEAGDGGGTEESASAKAQPIVGAEPADGEELTGIPIDTERSEAVSIYYGSVCYSYFSEEKEKIKEVAELFRGFSLEEAKDGQLDEATTYQVYFTADTEQIAAVNVDKNGVFYVPEEKKFYKIKAGTFHFEKLDEIYKDSMYKDGFDENQCLIQ